MRCHICGGVYKATNSDLPFNLSPKRILILKDLPVLQCGQCGAYLIEDPIMRRVEQLLEQAHATSELEIMRYAA